MVDLLEYEGKQIFQKYQVPVTEFKVIRSESDIPDFSERMVIKAQVPVGGRGKRGGVVPVNSKQEALIAMDKIRKIDFDGHRSEVFLLEKAYSERRELYLSVTLDRSKELPVILASAEGGMDINSVPAEKIYRHHIVPYVSVPEYVKRELGEFLGLKDRQIYEVVDALYSIYDQMDASLVEINPLAVTDGGLTALDSKITVEDDALFRHQEIEPRYFGLEPVEIEARKKGLSFVRLEGDIGIIANGAGLNMATIDMISLRGGRPANFFDLGGTDDPAKVIEALKLESKIVSKVLFINIFGGVTRCDTVATGIVQAVKELKPDFKIVVRLRGANEEQGRHILQENGIESLLNLDQAIDRVVKLAGE
ncbi:MAG: ADP-forming succinate--CoA ligase subunit beta [Nitrososphaerota archaeon]|nr:ADP-forming succinate--CoA ligase subunit beta [Nitrososphaerota archaeon]MDG6932870.1 ADP-forming succinate--CoA ligase subunit beta [Nitrososphaerota archaeon]MDG6936285.1 ADP-forming succinate--CoA ligase subunit beta [Nitrososphaerota archaeon]MDG6944915.1 ADP-forming succinate--CoA ligase subunit beta [Nitrososphaerota archaeon]